MLARGSVVEDCTKTAVRRCVTSQVRAEARRADKVHDGVPRAFRVGEVEGFRHGLKTEGVVVHIQRCEGNDVGMLLRGPLGRWSAR